jgi:hypothetical protein
VTSAADEAASLEMMERLREAAESREIEDAPLGFVADATGGDPILWDNLPRGVPDAAEHRRY